MCIQQHHFDRNRKAVQQGLDRRKEARAEAAQDADERALQAELRKSQERREAEKVAAEAAVCRHVAQVVEETNLETEQRKAKIHQEHYRRDRKALAAKQLRAFLLRTFGPLVIAAVLLRNHNICMIPLWVAISWSIFACIYSVWNFLAYSTRNWKRMEVNHHG